MKIIKKIILLFSSIIIFFSMIIKPDSEPPVLNDLEKQSGILHDQIRTHRKPIKKFKKLARQSIEGRLEKLKIGTFISGTATAIRAGSLIHTWGHMIAWNHFFPNAFKMKIRPLCTTLEWINTPNVNVSKESNYFKKAAFANLAGPVIGFLNSHVLFKLLAKYNVKNPTYSPFLSGLEFGLIATRYLDITSLIIPSSWTDGYQAIQHLRKKESTGKKWYDPPVFMLAHLALATKFLKPDFVKNCSHLFS